MVEGVRSEFAPLEDGEPIGVVALSGPVDPSKLEAGLAVLRSWGHPVVEACNLRRREPYLAGSDVERLAGLEEVVAAGARVVLAARGGYGCSRLLPSLPFDTLRRRGVCLVGFSDLTALINPLSGSGGAVQVHGPMVASDLARPANAARLQAVLDGTLSGGELFRFADRSVGRHGCVSGPALGGNLSLVCALLGTPWEPDLEGSVLFLEEVGEPLYRLDRMLTHLRASASFYKVKALIGGTLRGCRPAADRAAQWRRLLLEAAPDGAPVVTGLPFGHGADNRAFPIGAVVELDTRRGRVTWR